MQPRRQPPTPQGPVAVEASAAQTSATARRACVRACVRAHGCGGPGALPTEPAAEQHERQEQEAVYVTRSAARDRCPLLTVCSTPPPPLPSRFVTNCYQVYVRG